MLVGDRTKIQSIHFGQHHNKIFFKNLYCFHFILLCIMCSKTSTLYAIFIDNTGSSANVIWYLIQEGIPPTVNSSGWEESNIRLEPIPE